MRGLVALLVICIWAFLSGAAAMLFYLKWLVGKHQDKAGSNGR